jgi:hypothetical protein
MSCRHWLRPLADIRQVLAVRVEKRIDRRNCPSTRPQRGAGTPADYCSVEKFLKSEIAGALGGFHPFIEYSLVDFFPVYLYFGWRCDPDTYLTSFHTHYCDSDVDLHRNLNQKQYIFAFRIAPAKVVKLLDSIAPSRIRRGQF